MDRTVYLVFIVLISLVLFLFASNDSQFLSLIDLTKDQAEQFALFGMIILASIYAIIVIPQLYLQADNRFMYHIVTLIALGLFACDLITTFIGIVDTFDARKINLYLIMASGAVLTGAVFTSTMGPLIYFDKYQRIRVIRELVFAFFVILSLFDILLSVDGLQKIYYIDKILSVQGIKIIIFAFLFYSSQFLVLEIRHNAVSTLLSRLEKERIYASVESEAASIKLPVPSPGELTDASGESSTSLASEAPLRTSVEIGGQSLALAPEKVSIKIPAQEQVGALEKAPVQPRERTPSEVPADAPLDKSKEQPT